MASIWPFARVGWSPDTQQVNITKFSKLPRGNEIIKFTLASVISLRKQGTVDLLMECSCSHVRLNELFTFN